MVPARKIRSACLRFLPGHWALSMQNLILLRFTDCAWVCRANAPDLKPSPRGKDDSPYQGEMSQRDKRGRGGTAKP